MVLCRSFSLILSILSYFADHIIPKCEIRQLLGQGSFAEIWEAMDFVEKAPVAIKLLLQEKETIDMCLILVKYTNMVTNIWDGFFS